MAFELTQVVPLVIGFDAPPGITPVCLIQGPSPPAAEASLAVLCLAVERGVLQLLVLGPDHFWDVLERGSASSTQPSPQPCQGRPGLEPQTSGNSYPKALFLALDFLSS